MGDIADSIPNFMGPMPPDVTKRSIADVLKDDNAGNVAKYINDKKSGEAVMTATVGGLKYSSQEGAVSPFVRTARADVPCPPEHDIDNTSKNDKKLKELAALANNMIKGAKQSPDFPVLESKEVKTEDILGQCRANYMEAAKLPDKAGGRNGRD
jgi:hypothetical protein